MCSYCETNRKSASKLVIICGPTKNVKDIASLQYLPSTTDISTSVTLNELTLSHATKYECYATWHPDAVLFTTVQYYEQ